MIRLIAHQREPDRNIPLRQKICAAQVEAFASVGVRRALPLMVAAVTVVLGAVSGLFGNATVLGGEFYASRVFPVEGSPSALVSSDFNNDGKVDVAIASVLGNSAGKVSILLSHGDGTFEEPVSYEIGYSSTDPFNRISPHLALGDFNGDNKADLVATNSHTYSNSVSVLLGNGDGTFQPRVDYGVAYNPVAVAVGDFNNDTKQDLAVANKGDYNVSILFGNGDGTFQSPVNTDLGDYPPLHLAAGDFNNDGKTDLAVATENASASLKVLLGVGDGTFQTATSYGVGGTPRFIFVKDFNGDTRPDLAVSSGNNSGDDKISVLLCQADGSFQPPASYAVAPGTPVSIASGDFNDDGRVDLVEVCDSSKKLGILLGQGDGTFQAVINIDGGVGFRSVVVGDFDGDGRADLAIGNTGGHLSLLRGNGNATFRTSANYDLGKKFGSLNRLPIMVVAKDLNNDGKLDLTAINERTSDLSVLLGNGDGTFQSPGASGYSSATATARSSRPSFTSGVA
jgi:hypothetical protein